VLHGNMHSSTGTTKDVPAIQHGVWGGNAQHML
jgi:hypothetical protein